MDEDEFRSIYHEVNSLRCVFEKAINSRISNCSRSQRFNLADREGVSCTSEDAQGLCEMYLRELKKRARFSLRISNIEVALPHGVEIKLQNGGALGLQSVLCQQVDSRNKVEDISALLEKAGNIEGLQYDKIIDWVSAYKGRSRKSANRCK